MPKAFIFGGINGADKITIYYDELLPENAWIYKNANMLNDLLLA